MNNEEMIHWWQGYVILEIRGQKIERFINRMMYARLSAWHVRRINEQEAQVSVAVKDFFKLRKLLKETGCRMAIRRKIGLPFLLRKMKGRAGLYTGAVLSVIIVYTFSMMIWTVDIEGIELPEHDLLARQHLAELGVERWGFKFRSASPEVIQRTLQEKLPHASWVGFTYAGTTARLEVVEKTLPDLPENSSPGHLVASKKAVIHDLFVEQGKPLVKPNQYVERGDILISGEIGSADDPHIIPAKGEVWGEVWYESELSLPLEQTRTVLTGEQYTRKYVQLGSFKIALPKRGVPTYKDAVSRESKRELTIKGWTVPVSWVSENVMESREVQQTLTEDEAVQLAQELSVRQMHNSLGRDVEIKDRNVLKKRIENGKVYIKMHYAVIEQIASIQFIHQGD